MAMVSNYFLMWCEKRGCQNAAKKIYAVHLVGLWESVIVLQVKIHRNCCFPFWVNRLTRSLASLQSEKKLGESEKRTCHSNLCKRGKVEAKSKASTRKVWQKPDHLYFTVVPVAPSVQARGRIRFEFEMVFEWPIFGLFLNRIFESNRIFYTYCNRVRIRRQSQSSKKKGTWL
jgi:hypothetical protein